LKKNHIKNKRKKTHVGKHYSNPQYFVRKATVEILHQLNIKKINFTKIVLDKKMWKNTVAIDNVSKKKTI
jgi:hypothetical protein